jgi:hypothetical protein
MNGKSLVYVIKVGIIAVTRIYNLCIYFTSKIKMTEPISDIFKHIVTEISIGTRKKKIMMSCVFLTKFDLI